MDLWIVSVAIRRHKVLFAVSMLIALLGAIAIPRNATVPVYVSTAKVLLTPPSSGGGMGGGNGIDSARWWFADEATLRELLASENLLERVIRQANLKTDWTELKQKVDLSPVTGGNGFSYRGTSMNLFQVTVKADSPAEAKAIAEVLIDEFVRYIQELSAQEFANTRRFLEELVAEAHHKVEETETRLLAITSSRDLASDEKDLSDDQRDVETEKLKLKEELATVQADLATVADYVNGRSQIPPWSLLQHDSNMLKNLDSAVSENRLKLLELESTYSATNQHVRDQQEKLAKVQTLYDTNMSSAAKALVTEKTAREEELTKRLAQLNSQLSTLRKRRLSQAEKQEVTKLERQLQVWDENHLSLVRQLYQARVVEQSSRRQGAISILEKPAMGVLPKDKELPSLVKVLSVAIPFSLFFSTALVLLVDYMGTTMQLAPRIEQSLGVPVIVVIPKVPIEFSRKWELFKSRLGISSEDLEDQPPPTEQRW